MAVITANQSTATDKGRDEEKEEMESRRMRWKGGEVRSEVAGK